MTRLAILSALTGATLEQRLLALLGNAEIDRATALSLTRPIHESACCGPKSLAAPRVLAPRSSTHRRVRLRRSGLRSRGSPTRFRPSRRHLHELSGLTDAPGAEAARAALSWLESWRAGERWIAAIESGDAASLERGVRNLARRVSRTWLAHAARFTAALEMLEHAGRPDLRLELELAIPWGRSGNDVLREAAAHPSDAVRAAFAQRIEDHWWDVDYPPSIGTYTLFRRGRFPRGLRWGTPEREVVALFGPPDEVCADGTLRWRDVSVHFQDRKLTGLSLHFGAEPPCRSLIECAPLAGAGATVDELRRRYAGSVVQGDGSLRAPGGGRFRFRSDGGLESFELRAEDTRPRPAKSASEPSPRIDVPEPPQIDHGSGHLEAAIDWASLEQDHELSREGRCRGGWVLGAIVGQSDLVSFALQQPAPGPSAGASMIEALATEASLIRVAEHYAQHEDLDIFDVHGVIRFGLNQPTPRHSPRLAALMSRLAASSDPHRAFLALVWTRTWIGGETIPPDAMRTILEDMATWSNANLRQAAHRGLCWVDGDAAADAADGHSMLEGILNGERLPGGLWFGASERDVRCVTARTRFDGVRFATKDGALDRIVVDLTKPLPLRQRDWLLHAGMTRAQVEESLRTGFVHEPSDAPDGSIVAPSGARVEFDRDVIARIILRRDDFIAPTA